MDEGRSGSRFFSGLGGVFSVTEAKSCFPFDAALPSPGGFGGGAVGLTGLDVAMLAGRFGPVVDTDRTRGFLVSSLVKVVSSNDSFLNEELLPSRQGTCLLELSSSTALTTGFFGIPRGVNGGGGGAVLTGTGLGIVDDDEVTELVVLVPVVVELVHTGSNLVFKSRDDCRTGLEISSFLLALLCSRRDFGAVDLSDGSPSGDETAADKPPAASVPWPKRQMTASVVKGFGSVLHVGVTIVAAVAFAKTGGDGGALLA